MWGEVSIEKRRIPSLKICHGGKFLSTAEKSELSITVTGKSRIMDW